MASQAHYPRLHQQLPAVAGSPVLPQATAYPAAAPFQSEALKELERTTNKDAIVTDAPGERFRLGFFDASCLIINRMIGTGIFNSPTTVIRGTRSTGGALLLWFFGILYSLSGAHVYIEYGLNVPRYVIDGVEQAVPRSGGDLHYLQFVYRWVRYKKGLILLSGCLFGISFICIGNMASNCISFALRVLQAAHPNDELNNGQVRAIAIAAAFFACFIHAVSRRGGIWLNNLLAVVKMSILFVIIITTFVVLGGRFKKSDGTTVKNVFMENMHYKVAFKNPQGNEEGEATANGYAAAFLSIIFAYSGFDQNNYVLGEMANPRRTFPRATAFAVAFVSIMYMLVNICYMAVVRAEDQFDGVVALVFFRNTFGIFGEDTADRIFNAFLALSSFGNIIVMTYTAARVKQEIAKQGFIPLCKFFGEDVDVSIGRFALYLRRKRGWRMAWLSPENHQEATPVGALILHFLSSIVLIFATYNIKAEDAYALLAGLMAYLIFAWFGFFLALGIFILRFWNPPGTEPAKTDAYRKLHPFGSAGDPSERKSWKSMTGRSVSVWLSILCSFIYLVANAFPIVVSWIPTPADITQSTVPWWVIPTVSWIILGFSTLWWLGFVGMAKYRERRQHKTLVCEVWPEFEPADRTGNGNDGGKVFVHEKVMFVWEGWETTMYDSSDVRMTAVERQPCEPLHQQLGPDAIGQRHHNGPTAVAQRGPVNGPFNDSGNTGPSHVCAGQGASNHFVGTSHNNIPPRVSDTYGNYEPNPPPAARRSNIPQ